MFPPVQLPPGVVRFVGKVALANLVLQLAQVTPALIVLIQTNKATFAATEIISNIENKLISY